MRLKRSKNLLWFYAGQSVLGRLGNFEMIERFSDSFARSIPREIEMLMKLLGVVIQAGTHTKISFPLNRRACCGMNSERHYSKEGTLIS